MSSAKPGLLVLTSTFPRWTGDATPVFILELCKRLAADFDLLVLAPHAPGALTEEELEGVRVRRYRYLPAAWERLAYGGGMHANVRRNPLLILQAPFLVFAQLLAVLQELGRRPCLIHAHWLIPQGLVACIAACLVRGTRVVCTVHGADLYAFHGRLLRILKSWVLRRSQRVTVVSRAMCQAALDLGALPAQVSVAPMGVETRQSFVPPPEDRKRSRTVLFVGRLVEKKGVRHLIEAFAPVLAEVQDVRLVVVGDGTGRAGLERLTERLGLHGHVEFTGALPHASLPARYQSAALSVFPFVVDRGGDREGLGLVVVEAQACGCPVIASDLPAVRDAVEDGKTGLLVPPGDSRALAAAMVRLLRDPARARQLGVAGRESAVATFDWEQAAAAYRAILAPGGQRPDTGLE